MPIDILKKDVLLTDDLEVNKKTLEIEVTTSSGTSGAKLPINYENDKHIINRPQINDVELVGNKTSSQLKLQDHMDAMTVQEIEKILYLD